MPPKVKSTIPSSKSATSSTRKIRLETGVQFLKGVGPRMGAAFAARGIQTVRDLLFFFPRTFEDRSQIIAIPSLTQEKLGAKVTLSLKVVSARQIPIRKLGRNLLEVRCTDPTETGTVTLKWFRVPYGIDKKFTPGTELTATGLVKEYQGRPEIIHPEITWGAAAPQTEHHSFGRLVPIYTEIDGIPSRQLRSLLWGALDAHVSELTEDLPPLLTTKHQLPLLSTAVRGLHFPTEELAPLLQKGERTPLHHRLIYEEFLKFQFLMLRQKLGLEKVRTQPWGIDGGQEAVTALEKLLPFRLTGGQSQALREILGDLALPHPMNRLIQGDVGSGKTAVAFLAAGAVLAEGGQVTLMAPTEILAEQHFQNAAKLFGGRLRCEILTGRTPAAVRKPLLARLAAGEPMVLVGTHALIEPEVQFKNLGLVLIDEQHRFGVEQRRTLKEKAKKAPHTLVLTATPIPRTLALTAYGDLTVSSIRERPPGRTPVQTRIAQDTTSRRKAMDQVRTQIQQGRQAYFVLPLVEDSEAEGFEHLKSAVSEAQRLQTEIFPEFKVGLLHGSQNAEEKAQTMARFKEGKIQILVSTTVIEVGVDVPNATVMAIEHAERFGLSQLHQLRGRVGRGAHQSYCWLLTHPRAAENAAQRLSIMEETEDGFVISEADLKIRGPGDFLGTRQSGDLPFKVGELVRDRDWLLKARNDAEELLRADPDLKLPENKGLRRYFEQEGEQRAERLKTS